MGGGAPLGPSPVDAIAPMPPGARVRITIASAARTQARGRDRRSWRIGPWLKLFAPRLVDSLAARAIERGR